MATLSIRVAAAVDDATERSDDTNFATNGGANTSIFSGRSGAGGNPFWYSAQRFQNVTIPPGSTINTATITFTSTTTETNSALTDIIYGNDVDDAANFTTDADIVNRAVTTASASYSVPTSLTTDSTYTSSDISTIIQEIIDRAGWASGNAICIINKPNAATVGDDVNYYTYSASTTKAVLLDIDYSPPATFKTWNGVAVGGYTSTDTIAFDASAQATGGTSSPITWSHTCSTSDNRILFVATFSQGTISAVSYNSLALTKILDYDYTSPTGNGELWYLIAPATGANTVSITHSGSYTVAVSGSYTGVNQTGFPDASDTQTSGAGDVTTLTSTVTTVADNCWLVAGTTNEGAALTAGSGAYLRQVGSNAAVALFDSNSAITPAGSSSMTVDHTPTEAMAMGMVSIAPGTTTVPAGIKSINGVS